MVSVLMKERLAFMWSQLIMVGSSYLTNWKASQTLYINPISISSESSVEDITKDLPTMPLNIPYKYHVNIPRETSRNNMAFNCSLFCNRCAISSYFPQHLVLYHSISTLCFQRLGTTIVTQRRTEGVLLKQTVTDWTDIWIVSLLAWFVFWIPLLIYFLCSPFRM